VKESVKTNLGRRARKALATRRRILDAAEALFVRDGYAATTIAAIAEEADVAVQTVYAIFGNKRTILTALLAVRVLGDDDPVPGRFPPRVQGREEWNVIERETDPDRQLALLAAFATQMGKRMAGLYEVLAGAASSDSEIAELYRKQRQARYADQKRIAKALARNGALRPELNETKAADIIWAVANPNTHHALVGERGWSAEEYERWLAHTLICALTR
jgi:TetR/AcrR family transcriptional regulator, regulator of autoinduction and epiphytic fitness